MSGFTPEQARVIAARQQHSRVIAVAGSGKTSTLIGQTEALLADGVTPRRLLVLMYNRSAQQDFLQRLRARNRGPLPDVRTFHSLGLSIYRTLIQRGLLPAFQGDILSDGELEPRIWRWLQELATTGEQAQDILNNKRKWVEPTLTFIERVKAGLEPPAVVFKQLGMPGNARLLIKTFERLEQWRKAQQRITFADMLYDPVALFSQRSDVAAQFANHLDHIVVDEFQDINAIQHLLLETLSGERATVTVVGDPDQTIYEFRGSDPSFMLHQFPERYPDSQVHTLSHTFRYGPQVALAANHLIHHNQGRQPVLTCAHDSTPDTALHLHRVSDETSVLVQQITQLRTQRPLADIAVLHRLWAQAARLELQLLTLNIAFQLETERGVLQRHELQPLLLLLSIASGRFVKLNKAARTQAWMTLLTQPYPKIQRDILKQMATRLGSATSGLGKHFMAQLPPKCSHWQQEQLALRGSVIQLAEQPTTTAKQLVSAWLNNTDYLNALASGAFSAQQSDEQKETVKAFLSFLQQNDRPAADADGWLQEIQKPQSSQGAKGLTLTSIHKAKGREWPVVLIPGLNQHFYPYRPDGDLRLPVDEESERRLLYVALTRGQQEVHLFTPAQGDERSAFVAEMEIPLSIALGKALRDPATPPTGELALPTGVTPLAQQYVQRMGAPLTLTGRALPSRATPNQIRRVRHNYFGVGSLLREEGSQIHIRFDDGKTRVFERDIVIGMLEEL
ncbi:ATP-dependent helicase [Salinispirillum sp. LH 10-3-1]|uniref:DNA 3'-5' helicase n=1 Tax=Salinispirillum sp. LH 10-3-1 TaxID=2952525 RepID=A0AB38YF26_9GAMM